MKTAESPRVALIEYRADILAQEIMTRREDVRLAKFDVGMSKRDSFSSSPAVEFIGTIDPDDDNHVACVFSITVWGTDKAINSEAAATRWMDIRRLEKLAKEGYALYHLPSIALCFSMIGDSGYCAWLMEPMLDPHNTLIAPKQLTCRRMGKNALDEIVDLIKAWYRQLRVLRDDLSPPSASKRGHVG